MIKGVLRLDEGLPHEKFIQGGEGGLSVKARLLHRVKFFLPPFLARERLLHVRGTVFLPAVRSAPDAIFFISASFVKTHLQIPQILLK